MEPADISAYTKLYEESKMIGRGNFGIVYLARNREDNSMLIAKKIALETLSEKEVDASKNEVLFLATRIISIL